MKKHSCHLYMGIFVQEDWTMLSNYAIRRINRGVQRVSGDPFYFNGEQLVRYIFVKFRRGYSSCYSQRATRRRRHGRV